MFLNRDPEKVTPEIISLGIYYPTLSWVGKKGYVENWDHTESEHSQRILSLRYREEEAYDRSKILKKREACKYFNGLINSMGHD
jgi:hypothetical protein